MMLAARGAIRASGAGLPYDAEVEYLEFTGTQWIEIPLVVDSSASVNITGYVSATNKELFSFDKTLTRQFNVETGATCYRWWTASRIDLGSGYVGALHSYKCGASLYVDGVLKGTMTPTISETTRKLYILNGSHNAASGRIYSVSVEYNGVRVLDCIPVRRGTTGYLYDRVSGKFFGNAGTGDFALGPDVVPVAYIESHGTEWIDTGVIGTDVGTLKMRLKKTDANGTRRFILNTARNPQPVGSSVYFDVNASGYFGQASNGYECIVGQWYDIEIVRGVGYYFDGTLRISTSHIFPFESANNLLLFWVSTNNKFIGQISALKIYDNNDTSVRSMLPVRVGTDGAMIDTLTRRIYRNAGTGAFTYGNDLKYPIPA